jgi:hypothetical protein
LLKKRVQEIPANKLLNASEHDLVQALVEDFRLDVPVIKKEENLYRPRGRDIDRQKTQSQEVSFTPAFHAQFRF